MLTKADKWLVGILLFISIAGIGMSVAVVAKNTNQTAQVWQNGKLIKTLPLKPGYREEFRVGNDKEYNIIEVENGRIRIKDADCPDRLCVKTGWISAAPQQIVCLPFKVVVKIISSVQDVDDIAR